MQGDGEVNDNAEWQDGEMMTRAISILRTASFDALLEDYRAARAIARPFRFGASLGGPLSQFDGHAASFLTLSMRCSGNTIITNTFVSLLAGALRYNSIPKTSAGPPTALLLFLVSFYSAKYCLGAFLA